MVGKDKGCSVTKILYISGPYIGQTHDHRSYCQIDAHINQARAAAIWCATNGLHFFCPHLHSAHFEVITPDVPATFWYALDLRFLPLCDGMLLLPGWYESNGARRELEAMARADDERGVERRPHFHFPREAPAILTWAKEVPHAPVP